MGPNLGTAFTLCSTWHGGLNSWSLVSHMDNGENFNAYLQGLPKKEGPQYLRSIPFVAASSQLRAMLPVSSASLTLPLIVLGFPIDYLPHPTPERKENERGKKEEHGANREKHQRQRKLNQLKGKKEYKDKCENVVLGRHGEKRGEK